MGGLPSMLGDTRCEDGCSAVGLSSEKCGAHELRSEKKREGSSAPVSNSSFLCSALRSAMPGARACWELGPPWSSTTRGARSCMSRRCRLALPRESGSSATSSSSAHCCHCRAPMHVHARARPSMELDHPRSSIMHEPPLPFSFAKGEWEPSDIFILGPLPPPSCSHARSRLSSAFRP
ncbi:hypothetical protein Dimus_037256 [Dionaea muscipula]